MPPHRTMLSMAVSDVCCRRARCTARKCGTACDSVRPRAKDLGPLEPSQLPRDHDHVLEHVIRVRRARMPDVAAKRRLHACEHLLERIAVSTAREAPTVIP